MWCKKGKIWLYLEKRVKCMKVRKVKNRQIGAIKEGLAWEIKFGFHLINNRESFKHPEQERGINIPIF